MKTDTSGFPGRGLSFSEDAGPTKETALTKSLGKWDSLVWEEEEGRATLILTFTLWNVKKAGFSKAAKIFEVWRSHHLAWPPASLIALPNLSTDSCLHFSLPLLFLTLAPPPRPRPIDFPFPFSHCSWGCILFYPLHFTPLHSAAYAPACLFLDSAFAALLFEVVPLYYYACFTQEDWLGLSWLKQGDAETRGED